MSGAKWIPPLPHGWEARYDHNQKAFFFINHAAKTTQWEDPRFHQKAPPAPPTPQHHNAAAAAASSLAKQDDRSYRSEVIAMRDMSSGPYSDLSMVDREESSLTNEQDKAVIDRLKAEFPQAARELISDMLMLCHNNERETREQLKDLGFQNRRAASSGPASSHTSPQHNISPQHHSSPQRQSSPLHEDSSASKKKPKKNKSHQADGAVPRPTSPARAEMSEADKKKVLNEMKAVYRSVDGDVIRIALDHCKYNVTEAKQLINAWEKRASERQAASSASSRAASAGTAASTTRLFSASPASLEPAGLDDQAAGRPQVMSGASGQRNVHQPGHRQQHKASTSISVTGSGLVTGVKVGSGGSKSSSTSATSTGHSAKSSARAPCSQTARAKQVTRLSENLLSSTSDLLTHLASTASCCQESTTDEEEPTPKQGEGREAPDAPPTSVEPKKSETTPKSEVVTSQPTPDKSKGPSQLRTEVKGPDASLRKGPDNTLLIMDYTQASGPNAGLRSGPDPTRVSGPKGGQGPDLTLRCGPQSSLLHSSPSHGQRTVVSPSGVLVSNI